MGKKAEVVRGIYDAFGRGDVPAVLGAFAPDIEWREADHVLYADGHQHVGPDAVAEGVFQRITSDVEEFAVVPDGVGGRFQQSTDTKQWAEAAEPPGAGSGESR